MRSKGIPGPSACGDIFRNNLGEHLGSFGVDFGHNSAYYAELMTAFRLLILLTDRDSTNFGENVIHCLLLISF